VIRAKVIDLPKEGLTAQTLEELINAFILIERPKSITNIEFNSEYGFLIIIYEKE
jgi:uncharacterized protein YheU (UPF0270 family)